MSPGVIVPILGMVLLAAAVCGAAFNIAATWALARFLGGRLPASAVNPAITVLRPMHGDEPQLYENLVSLCDQNYAGPVQIILGVQDAADPAADHARHLQREHPQRDIALVIDPAPHGTNRKIANLINMSPGVTGDIVVVSDSDVRLPVSGLSVIAAMFDQPDIGLIHCLYRGRPAAGAWARLASMDSNTRFIPSVVAGDALGAHPCLGPTMALPKAVLDRIGGFAYLADFLADDFELGRVVRGLGFRIGCPPIVIDHVFPERSLREMLIHEMRWARTVRLVAPGGYFGSLVTHAFALAVIGAALTGFSGAAIAVLLAIALARLIQAAAAAHILHASSRDLWLLPFRDLLSFGVFIAAHLGARVEWRGHRLVVARDGSMAAS
jgi:ceramide glucosyltransferase